MKTTVTRLVCLIIAIAPLSGMAQSHIKSAFEAIIKCPEAQISETHSLDKDPDTNIKSGQCDIYNFVLPADKMKLINNVFSAFEKDNSAAYGCYRGKRSKGDALINTAVGDGTGTGITINDPDCEYVYALFLAPKSETHPGKNQIYRYAYAMNFKESGNKIKGKLVITYATTLKYRQQVAQEKRQQSSRTVSSHNGLTVLQGSSLQQSWFDILMSYFQTLSSAKEQTRIALATKAYKHISNMAKYPEVTDADKTAAREILKALIADPEYSETVLNKLLQQCLNSIK